MNLQQSTCADGITLKGDKDNKNVVVEGGVEVCISAYILIFTISDCLNYDCHSCIFLALS